MSPTALVGVDWGTTRLRVYRIDADGQPLERRESTLGIAGICDGDFSVALESLVADWCAERPGVPILMCGMVGSRQGWRETPYAPCPVSPGDCAMMRVQMGHTAAWIVGGASTVDERGRYDVMRGEETQVFGTVENTDPMLIVTPGTHSKWVLARNGRIESFRTYLTGELYSVLKRHSTLGWPSGATGEDSIAETTFLEGIQEARAEPDLLHSLFGVRTRALFESWDPATQSSYLSGVLIGHEVVNGLRGNSALAPIVLIASSTLCKWYEMAFNAFDVPAFRIINSDLAVCRGLWKLSRLNLSR